MERLIYSEMLEQRHFFLAKKIDDYFESGESSGNKIKNERNIIIVVIFPNVMSFSEGKNFLGNSKKIICKTEVT